MSEKEKRMEAYICLLQYMLKHDIREHEFDADYRPRLKFRGMEYLPIKLFIDRGGCVKIQSHYPTAQFTVCPNMFPPFCDMPAEDIYLILDAMRKDIIREYAEYPYDILDKMAKEAKEIEKIDE